MSCFIHFETYLSELDGAFARGHGSLPVLLDISDEGSTAFTDTLSSFPELANHITCTRSLKEACACSPTITVTDGDKIVQTSAIHELRRQPIHRKIAERLFSPSINLFSDPTIEADTVLGLYPEDIHCVAAGQGDWIGQCKRIEPFGRRAMVLFLIEMDDWQWSLRMVCAQSLKIAPGQRVGIAMRKETLLRFDAKTGFNRSPFSSKVRGQQFRSARVPGA